jgi:hypothetical protein
MGFDPNRADFYRQLLTRRDGLKVGGLSAFGLGLDALLGGRAHANETARAAAAVNALSAGSGSFGKAKACIVLFLLGGPPQQETWDPKPEAPQEVRGDYGVIASKTPGLQVGELMPKTANLTDKVAVLRAMSTDDNAHSSSGYWMLTGRPHAPKNSENSLPGAPNDWPCLERGCRRIARIDPVTGRDLEYGSDRLAWARRRLARGPCRPVADHLRPEQAELSRPRHRLAR